MPKKTTSNKKQLTMRKGHGLGQIRSVQSFRALVDSQGSLTAKQRTILIEQAEILLRELYTHMPLKRAMHAIDPLQALRLLKQKVGEYSTGLFQAELLSIFKSLRDLHTNYSLPAPFGKQVAFLGILVERYFENGESKWMVSKIAEHLVTDSVFTEGVEITHWNGMPIELAVWRNADKEAGSNEAAQLARGLETLTLRFLRSSLPPDEDWVAITYLKDGVTKNTTLNWLIFDSFDEVFDGASDRRKLYDDLVTPLRHQMAMDERGEYFRQARKMIFNRSAIKEFKRVARYKGKVPRPTKSLDKANIIPTNRPDELTAKIVSTQNGEFGWLRIWTFHMQDQGIEEFINEVARLLRMMPKEGLILDVRGNGGGYIIAAEFLLQFFTPNRIKPEPTQFIATEGAMRLANSDSSYSQWRKSLRQAVATGAPYSAGVPISPEGLINSVGQLYFGPVALITDAYCYSACDMFAAGFQDHEIGTVVGVDAQTGAGGANVVTHSQIREDWATGPLEKLPNGADMRVSLRRTLRVGKRSGEPVEDLGVQVDELYEMTRDDLLKGNKDLLEFAGSILADGVPRLFNLELSEQGNDLIIDVSAENVSSVDVYVKGRPIITQHKLLGGNASISLKKPNSGSEIRVEGYSGSKLVAGRNLKLN